MKIENYYLNFLFNLNTIHFKHNKKFFKFEELNIQHKLIVILKHGSILAK